MSTMNGAEITIRLLERQGIDLIAGIPGGANLPLYDALSQSSQIRHILTRHEQGAGFVAQGLARVRGIPQVCFATSGPGATNIITAIADAKLDSVPLICITGQVPLPMVGTDAFQEVDTYGMTLPITKHNYLVRSLDELLHVIPDAFRVAASGRPGPVVIDIPKDVQMAQREMLQWPEPGTADAAATPSDDSITRAAELINQAKRPVLYIGGGVIQGEASNLARELAERINSPTTMTLMGLGAMPPEHPLAIGMLGMHAAPYTNLVLEECDLLLAAGVRFDDRATGKVAQFCPDAKIIHIDIDPSELNKIKTAHVGLVGDVASVIERLLPKVHGDLRAEWVARTEELRRDHPLELTGNDELFSPYGIVHAVADCVSDDAIVATDVGQHQMWAAQAYPLRKPRRWLTSGGLGTMGFGLPAAIGAALAEPDATVICFTGDGSLMMNLQELATAAEVNANLKLILLNNSALGLVKQQQHLFYGQRLFASHKPAPVDYVQIARGFGVRAIDLSEAEDPASSLRQAIEQPGPVLIHVPIESDARVYPMVPPGGANRDMIRGEQNVTA
jgi:acetolactate synthase-1/2/3 large subunit